MHHHEILKLYDQKERRETSFPKFKQLITPHTVRLVDISQVHRHSMVIYYDLTVDNMAEAVEAEIDFFEAQGHNFEWKLYEHDAPPGLKGYLHRRGFEVGDLEAFMVLDLAKAPRYLLDPVTVDVKKIVNPNQLAEVLQVQSQIWGRNEGLEASLARSLREVPDTVSIYSVYAGGMPVSTAWISFVADSPFAGLWGGSTLPGFRKMGFYTALLATRLQEAKARGIRFLTIDARPMSRSIVARYGFEYLTATYPCEWIATPPDQHPTLTTPPPLRGVDGGFTETSIAVRLKTMLQETIHANDFSAAQLAKLTALDATIPYQTPPPIPDNDLAPDAPAWRRLQHHFKGQTWLTIPWFAVETYFYRLLANYTGALTDGQTPGPDHFAADKQAGFTATLARVHQLADALAVWLNVSPNQRAVALRQLLHANLWGNQADFTILSKEEVAGAAPTESQILVDQSTAVARWLLAQHNAPGRIDVIVDNAGYELAADLALVDFLLETNLAQRVQLHLKPYPAFVSDVTRADIDEMVSHFNTADHPATRAWGVRLAAHLQNGRLILAENYFWTSALSGWQMPAELRAELAAVRVLISKGDANYRRFLGDRRWDPTTDFVAALGYLPAPLVALRTLKSDSVVGLPASRIKSLDAADPDWRYGGKWGLIQHTISA